MPHITVPRTARYYVLGEPSPAVRELWVVCHGYGMLAEPFLSQCASLARADRLIVAPEALSRFYAELKVPHTANSAIGASWMTREDREAEITDQIVYLDTLCQHLRPDPKRMDAQGEPLIIALGFSQGVATAARWAAAGQTRISRVIAWGAPLPTDLDLADFAKMTPQIRVDVVYGTQDRFMTEKVTQIQRDRLIAAGVSYAERTYEGGHHIDEHTLSVLVT